MLYLKQAKENVKKFKKGKVTIVPTLTNDWIIKLSSMYHSGSWIHIRSSNLGVDIKLCQSDEFLKKNFFNGQQLNIKRLDNDNRYEEVFELIGNYAICKDKIFISEDEFILSEDLVEANQA